MHAPDTSPGPPAPGSRQDEPLTGLDTTRPETLAAGQTPSAPTAEPTPVHAFGSYQLLEEIDRGGMGVVYRARQTGLDRLVALKMILSGPAAQREEVLRFQREARAAGRLRHPNIIAVHDAGTIDGQHYMTMPLASGGSLAQHVKRLSADPRAAVAIVEKVARAVQHAHENGILHRDLKPANVLLDEGDEPWVADFGLAKVEDADELQTRIGHGMGTPAYMAPEQSDPGLRRSGPATDIWALGVILYELLAGRRPFRGRPETMLHRIRDGEPARLRPGIDANLEAVVLKCLNKEASRRYASAGALADDLARWLRGEAPLVRPEGPVARAVRWGRRHTAAIAAGVALVGLAVVLPILWPSAGTPVNTTAPDQTTASAPTLRLPPDPREPIELIGHTGEPHYAYQQVVGRKGSDVMLAMDDRTFTYSAWGLNLLELVPGVAPWDEFRLRAQVKLRGSDNGSAGIYACYRKGTSPKGVEHSFCTLFCTDRPPAPPGQARAELQLVWYGEPLVPALNEHGTSGPNDFPLVAADEGWHPLTLEVTHDGLLAFWGANPCGRASWHYLKDLAAGLARDRPAGEAPPPIPAAGAVGLYVYRGTASFRDVVIEPIGAR